MAVIDQETKLHDHIRNRYPYRFSNVISCGKSISSRLQKSQCRDLGASHAVWRSRPQEVAAVIEAAASRAP
jgi:hypothetical protein